MASKTTAKTDVAKTEAASPAKTEAPAAAPNKTPYRTAPEFLPALKSAKGLAKGNPEYGQALQLITHLAWKSEAGTVSWTAGTTASVVSYAEDLALGVGTPIKAAMAEAVKVATGAAETDAQKEAMTVLSKVIADHEA